jgi:integrase/recombinase XerC
LRTLTPQDEFRLLFELGGKNTHVDEHGFRKIIDMEAPQEWKSARNTIAAVLMMDAGLRVGEVVGLWVTDVYFQNKPVSTLTVRAAIAKGRRIRHIPVTQRLNAALARFNQRPYLLPDLPDIQRLIANKPQGHGLTTRTLERIITAAGVAALGHPVNPHMLRHTYATKLLRVTDIRTVQELLGHKHIGSTQIYTHVNDEDKRRAIYNMENKFGSFGIAAGRPDLPGQVHKQR